MRWAQEQRQQFIAHRLLNPGYINRQDLVDEFRICVAQASKDLQVFQQSHPNYMVYHKRNKRYEIRPEIRECCD